MLICQTPELHIDKWDCWLDNDDLEWFCRFSLERFVGKIDLGKNLVLEIRSSLPGYKLNLKVKRKQIIEVNQKEQAVCKELYKLLKDNKINGEYYIRVVQ